MAKNFAELLHAAVKVDAHGAVGKAGAFGDFGAAHAFDKAQDQGFAIGFGKREDGVESGVGFGGGVRGGTGWQVVFFVEGFFGKFMVRFAAAVKVGGAIAGDRSEPAGEFGDFAKRGEARKGLKENILDEVVDIGVGNPGKKDAVDHAGITGIEKAEGGAVALLRGADEGLVRAGVHGEPAGEWSAQFKWHDHGGAGAGLFQNRRRREARC